MANITVKPNMIRPSRPVPAMVADLYRTPPGVPGPLPYREYLVDRWRHRVRRGAIHQRTANHPCHVASTSATDARDDERS